MAQKSRKKQSKKNPLFTKGKSDYVILIVVSILVVCGLIMVLSASAPASLSEGGDSYKYFKKQLLGVGVGIVAMIFTTTLDYRTYKKFSWIIYVVLIALLALVGLTGLSEGGATRWIRIAGINFQPSELAKVGFILFFADILTEIKKEGKIKKFLKGFCYPLILTIPIIISIYVLQNHLSATLLIIIVTCIQMAVVGVPLRYFAMCIMLAISALGGYLGIKVLNKPEASTGSFRITRLQTWIDPFSDPTGDGWQIIQSFYAIASGGLFGLGFGESKQKYLYLPEPHNDFIFSVLAEETGFLGCVTIIILFMILIWRGIVVAIKAPDTYGSLIAIGITVLIGLQAIINIAVVTGTIPVTGMPLPFFSYGGTAITINLATMGILLNISKSCNQK